MSVTEGANATPLAPSNADNVEKGAAANPNAKEMGKKVTTSYYLITMI